MLSSEQRKILSKTASEKYNLDIAPTQIAHLVLDNFECNLNFGGKNDFIKGRVDNFRKFPLRMDFEAAKGSKERDILKSYLQQHSQDLKFKCKLSSVSHTVKINTLAISSSEYQQMGIREKLLGSASSKYVNREQLNHLAGQLYSSLNVVEEYEMPEYQFQKNFVEDFIRQATAEHFQQVPALQALKELSSYGIDFSQDLQAGKANLT
jgi:hypothetical protein